MYRVRKSRQSMELLYVLIRIACCKSWNVEADVGVSFPSFNHNIGHSNTEFSNAATLFLNRSVEKMELDELKTPLLGH